jgi:nucleotide-binding universal stress UspA family protein
MTIRVILAPLSGGAASEGAVETACRLAKRFGAHVAALHVKLDSRGALPLLGPDVAAPVASQLVEAALRESDESEERAKALFEAAIARHGLPARTKPTAGAPEPSASWRVETGAAAAIVAQQARLADLVVLGQSGRVTDQPHTETLEETLLTGGRPVLLAPARALARLGEVVAIAWNGSPQAARAVAAALPFLAQAREVHVLRAGKAEEEAAPDLEEYLAWHGIAAAPHAVQPVEGAGVGEVVLAAAREVGSDLLVMGGYGRAPWREMIFGGATRHIVATSRLPVLLAH